MPFPDLLNPSGDRSAAWYSASRISNPGYRFPKFFEMIRSRLRRWAYNTHRIRGRVWMIGFGGAFGSTRGGLLSSEGKAEKSI